MSEFTDILLNGCMRFDVELTQDNIKSFIAFKELLKEKNKVMNLTAITDDSEIAVKHFIDSITLIPIIKELGINNIIDIGTGAGFPGIPIKIVCPNIKVTLVDSLDKRVTFLKEVISELELEGVEAVHSRAEEIGRESIHREKYDFVTARAVASMPVLLEYCIPLTKTGGYFAAMKGSKEEPDFSKACTLLGCNLIKKSEIMLNSGLEEMKRTIFVFKKEKNISTNYPRKPGLPSKKPLV